MRFVLVIVGIVCLPGVVSAQVPDAQAPDEVFLEELTWTEVRDALDAGTTTVIIPTGGTEQNGPHMVLGKHNYLVRYKAGEVARRLGDALVAPVMAYVPEGDVDPPTGHMRFPGTITTPPEVFEQVLEFAARSFKQHGFLDIANRSISCSFSVRSRSSSERGSSICFSGVRSFEHPARPKISSRTRLLIAAVFTTIPNRECRRRKRSGRRWSITRLYNAPDC